MLTFSSFIPEGRLEYANFAARRPQKPHKPPWAVGPSPPAILSFPTPIPAPSGRPGSGLRPPPLHHSTLLSRNLRDASRAKVLLRPRPRPLARTGPAPSSLRRPQHPSGTPPPAPPPHVFLLRRVAALLAPSPAAAASSSSSRR